MLKFSPGNDNAKLKKGKAFKKGKGYTFSLLSGWSCPQAMLCQAKVFSHKGKKWLEDGKHSQFRCFSASQEVLYPAVYRARKHNMQQLLRRGGDVRAMAKLINSSLPKDATIVRIHVAGDFYNEAYFDAWLSVATMRPECKFYAYTKSLGFWVKRLKSIPNNLILTASRGGRQDELIAQYNLREAVVVANKREAKALGLKVDVDDSLAQNNGPSFALIIHGVQPAGSLASRAVQENRRTGKASLRIVEA